MSGYDGCVGRKRESNPCLAHERGREDCNTAISVVAAWKRTRTYRFRAQSYPLPELVRHHRRRGCPDSPNCVQYRPERYACLRARSRSIQERVLPQAASTARLCSRASTKRNSTDTRKEKERRGGELTCCLNATRFSLLIVSALAMMGKTLATWLSAWSVTMSRDLRLRESVAGSYVNRTFARGRRRVCACARRQLSLARWNRHDLHMIWAWR